MSSSKVHRSRSSRRRLSALRGSPTPNWAMRAISLAGVAATVSSSKSVAKRGRNRALRTRRDLPLRHRRRWMSNSSALRWPSPGEVDRRCWFKISCRTAFAISMRGEWMPQMPQLPAGSTNPRHADREVVHPSQRAAAAQPARVLHSLRHGLYAKLADDGLSRRF